MPGVSIAASVLNADFGRLAAQIAEVEAAGVDSIHIDVMDGHFVSNLSLGFGIVEAIRRGTKLPLDLHLMIEHPERYLERFQDSGADLVTVHLEAVHQLHATLSAIRALGMKVGLALSPGTSLSMATEVLVELDLLLVMTINPGFGGQKLIPSTIGKIRRARNLLNEAGSVAALQVDGGVKPDNVAELCQAGATCLVVGTGIFQAPAGIAAGVSAIRRAIAAA